MEKDHDTAYKAHLIPYKDERRFTCQTQICNEKANIVLTKLMGVERAKKNIYVCFACYDRITTSSYVKTLNLKE